MKKGIKTVLCMCIVVLIIFFNISINIIALEEEQVYENQKDCNDKFVVCIDAGHQAKGDPRPEPVAPGSGQSKARVSSGTAGVATKKAEYVVNLEASMILKEILINKGYEVIMTRESHDVKLSNIERAQIANKANADITIRVHCDSISNGGKSGASILVPAKSGKYTKEIYEDSNIYAEALKSNLKESGINVLGIFERNDITGFNWSKVPVVILEMGFMSNWNEDQMLATNSYQTKLMEATAKAVDTYKENILK